MQHMAPVSVVAAVVMRCDGIVVLLVRVYWSSGSDQAVMMAVGWNGGAWALHSPAV